MPLEDGVGFDGASIQGFARMDESDMVAMPDPTTFRILPWRPRQNAVARMMCDILTPKYEPFEGDPRVRPKAATWRTPPQSSDTPTTSPRSLSTSTSRDSNGVDSTSWMRRAYFDQNPHGSCHEPPPRDRPYPGGPRNPRRLQPSRGRSKVSTRSTSATPTPSPWPTPS